MANPVSDESLAHYMRGVLQKADEKATYWLMERQRDSEVLAGALCWFKIGDRVVGVEEMYSMTVKRVQFATRNDEIAEDPEFILELLCDRPKGCMASRNGTNTRLREVLTKIEK